LTVGVVGAGRVGAVLGNALRAVGHSIVGASGASAATLDRIDAMLPGVPVLEVQDVVARAEVVLLTVSDDALPGLVSGLAALGVWQPGQLVVHTAGRYGVDVLEPARRAGAIPMAIHPAMTFTGTSLDLARLAGCPFAVTAAATVLPIAQALALEMGGEPMVLPEEARVVYHAALSHGANHLVTLIAQAERVLEAVGVDEPGRLLAPVLTAALDGAIRGGETGLTGPVVRGDVGTVSEHLRAIGALAAQDERLVDVPPAYIALARATVQRSLALRRLSDTQAEAILDVLGPGPAEATTALATSPSLSGPPAATADAAGSRALLQRAASAGEPGAPAIARSRAELDAALAALPGRRAVVMTMGALHEGHLELVRQAHAHGDHVIVTIFVNPLQFGAGEDLERYPRTLEADVAALGRVGVDLVFAPEPAVVYPDGSPLVRVSAGPMGDVWEGAVRPGHFDGVLTVVNKLMNLLRPDVALFGQKDAQQLALIRRMVRDLDLGVEVVAVPIQRDADGLALSSRNAYLTPGQRESALVLSRALRAAGRAAEQRGARPADIVEAAAAQFEEADAREPGAVEVDYVTLVDPDDLQTVPAGYRGTALLAMAARVGGTRLIDNALIHVGASTSPAPAGDG
jgi:pantoate--beta-alanine ligase